VTPSVTAPGDTNLSDATGNYFGKLKLIYSNKLNRYQSDIVVCYETSYIRVCLMQQFSISEVTLTTRSSLTVDVSIIIIYTFNVIVLLDII